MKSIARWILSVVGYGIYTLAVLVLLLWFLFPAESFRAWLTAELDKQSESVGWEIGAMHIAWPFSIAAEDVKAVAKESGESLFLVNEFKVMPDVTAIARIGSELPLSYRARTLGGVISGDVLLARKGNGLICSGQMKKVQIGGMEGLWKLLGRNASGDLSGSFSYEGKRPLTLDAVIRGDLVLNNGSMGLQQPVFGMDKLEFNKLTVSLDVKDRTVNLEKGKVDANLFAADFSGTVTLADNFLGSGLDIKGNFEPRPELLGGLNNAAVVELVRGELRDDKLAFTITDTLLEPGLNFQGVSGVIDGMIQGRNK